MSKPITPGRAHVFARAFELRVTRIVKHSRTAVASLHDNQPGIRSASDGPSGRGWHSDPAGDLAVDQLDGHRPDPARAALDEVSALFATVDDATIRLDHLLRNWAGPSTKWRDALATEAAAKLNDEHNWCRSHSRAGVMEPAEYANGAQCRWCKDYSRDLGADPPVWMIEKHDRGKRITTADMTRAKREAKSKRKRKR